MELQEVGCGEACTALVCSGYGQVAGACERGQEPSGSIKCGEFLDFPRNFPVLKEHSISLS